MGGSVRVPLVPAAVGVDFVVDGSWLERGHVCVDLVLLGRCDVEVWESACAFKLTHHQKGVL